VERGTGQRSVCRALARENLMTTAQAIKQQMRVRYPEYFASPAPPPANVKVSGNAQALRGSVAVRVHSDTMLTWDDGRSLGGWGQLQARSPSARSWLEALILGVRKSLMVRGRPTGSAPAVLPHRCRFR